MLDRAKLIKSLSEVSDSLFVDYSDEYNRAIKVWQKICADSTFLPKIKSCRCSWNVPFWDDALNGAFDVEKVGGSYNVVAIDGSQVYPDRHRGVACFLINIGTVCLMYGQSSACELKSIPYVFLPDQTDFPGDAFSAEYVDSKRQELEFLSGLEKVLELQKTYTNKKFVLLLDGSLIFWHLDSYGVETKNYFLSKYINLLEQMRQSKIIVASYISMPKSKELINLIKLDLCNFDPNKYDSSCSVDHLVDATIVGSYLPDGKRSSVFKNNSTISKSYPESLVPHFFYLNVGDEIVRVEIPAWIAQEKNLVNQIASACLDQSIKGGGYPVCLAESHEQAVVKGADRDFFFQVVDTLGIGKKRKIIYSQKSLKKKRLGI